MILLGGPTRNHHLTAKLFESTEIGGNGATLTFTFFFGEEAMQMQMQTTGTVVGTEGRRIIGPARTTAEGQ
jgi:hypothetical protein